MTSDDKVVGVLNLYSTSVAFGPPDEQGGTLFADEATTAIRHADSFVKGRQLVDNLTQALDTRAEIGAAVGVIMQKESLSMDHAFNRLVDISKRENIKLREVADRITEQFETP